MCRSIYKNLIGILILGFATSSTAFATIQAPYINIQDQAMDAGSINSNGNFSIDATALSVTNSSSSTVTILEDFRLAASYLNFSNSAYNFNNGTISIGTLLSATFDNLSIVPVGSNSAVFFADLTYTNGSLIGNLISGRLEGTLFGVSGAFDSNFTAPGTFISVGEVSAVPLPAAIWLFIPMLSGLFGIGFRNRSRQIKG